MSKREIIILNTEIAKLKFDDNNERTMTKITYAIEMRPDNQNFAGLDILTNYVNEAAFDVVKDFVGQVVDAFIEERPTKNGSKYVIKEINNIAF